LLLYHTTVLERIHRVVWVSRLRTRGLQPIGTWALAVAVLLHPIAALGADPAAEAEKNVEATELHTPDPDREQTDAEAAQEEEKKALEGALLEQEMVVLAGAGV